MIQDGYSICMNEWAINPQTRNELPLLVIISSLSAKTGECFASNKFFADLLGFDEATVSRKICKLVELGVIEAKYEKRGFQVTKRVLRLTKMSTVGLQKCQSTDDENVKYKNISIKNNIYMSDFEEFWKHYPKQRVGSKTKAYSSYCRVIKEKRSTAERLLDAVKKYANSTEVKRGFAKGCAAWLNDDRFNNSYEVEKDDFIIDWEAEGFVFPKGRGAK